MIYKGRVLKLEENSAVVMTDDAQYVKVVNKVGLTAGKQILFVDEDIYKEKNIDISKHYKYAAVFVLFLFSSFLMLNFNNIYMSKDIAAVITMDINPSIELEINNEERVIKITSLNQEANEILNRNLVKKKIDEVIEALLVNAEALKYFEQQDSIVLLSMTVLNKDSKIDLESIKAEVKQILDKNAGLHKINITYMDVYNTSLYMARTHNMSMGRYQMYEEIKEYSNDITIESAKTMKLGHLVMRHRYKGESQHDSIDIREIESGASEQIQDQTKTQNREGMKESNGNGNKNMNGNRNGESEKKIPNEGDSSEAGSGRHKYGKQEPQIESSEEGPQVEEEPKDNQDDSEEAEDKIPDRTQEKEAEDGKPEKKSPTDEQNENIEKIQQKPQPGENKPRESEDENQLLRKSLNKN